MPGVGSHPRVEALVRWHHPEQGELPAAAFMPAVEQEPVIHEIGAMVVREACMQAAAWQRLAADGLYVSVNLCAPELDDPTVPARIEQALHASGLDPERLCVEVTEGALVHDFEGSVERLRTLKRLGVTVAIDDFGTGYSSLSYVHRFPADSLKIDRTFVAALGVDRQVDAVVGGVVLLARSLGMAAVAEGVETAEQARHLAALGCEQVQGFHFSRPLPAAAITEQLRAASAAVHESSDAGSSRHSGDR